MRKILLGMLAGGILLFIIQEYIDQKKESQTLQNETALIQKELANVGKLIVTEGSFAEVITYENDKKLYFDLLSAKKKALIVVNVSATISYDLEKIAIQLDTISKIVSIVSIPEPELTITPDIQYYDLQQDYLNPFEAEDYNKIQTQIKKDLTTKIKASALYANAQNRLVSELQKIYVLTNTLGWSLLYDSQPIKNTARFEQLNQ